MKKKYFIIFLTILSLSIRAYSQINCTVPLPPVLTRVSVQPETGKTDFTWTPSPSSDIAAYIIYTYKNGDGLPIDTIWDPLATTFTLTSTATKYFSVSYVITAHRLSAVPGLPGCTSPLSNVVSTIFCNPILDTCDKKIVVKWNRYADYPRHVTEYMILAGKNGSPLSDIYTASNLADSFIISNFSTDSQYCIAVKAILEDGTESTSNKSCLTTKMQRPPDWINADYASVNNEKNISLSFTIDPMSEINHFNLERKSVSDETYQVIKNAVSSNGSVLYTDNTADIGKINYYRLSAVNNCNISSTVSNIASNVVLTSEFEGGEIILNWNSYQKWLGIISAYRVLINTGKGFEEKVSLPASDTTYKLGYKEIMYDVSGSEVCFLIESTEASNPHGITGKSNSSQVCITPTELITVPNVFTPNNDLVNDYFRPVLSFTPAEYHLVIMDRKGVVLFETRDFNAEWDGTGNGTPQPQGVYLWFLKAVTPSGKSISKTGTITIIRDK
jgi:gliding motility-associated-like protein